MKNEIHISIFGEQNIPKLELINYYIKTNNISEIKPKKGRLAFYVNKTKVKIYEFSEIPEKRAKDISNNQCVIIVFDMTERKSFTDILDKWIKFLKELKYSNKIILFGTSSKEDKNALTMTDEQEINYLIEITGIKGKFYDLRNLNQDKICELIDTLIEQIFEYAQNNINKKDCQIF